MIGIFLVVLDGLWVVDTYDSYDIYPREAYIFLNLGLCLTIIAYMIMQHKRKHAVLIKNGIMNEPAKETESQHLVNRIWEQRMTVGNKLVGFFLLFL